MLVSIVIPAYNREGTIAASVESALAQDHPEIEVIVVDDGSTDGTFEALGRFGERIVAIRQPNAGPSAARNRGAAVANGGIIAFLDSDDLWLPSKISRQVALMERAGRQLACCVCNAEVKGAGGAVLGNTFDHAGIRPEFAEGVWTNAQEVLSTRFLLFNQVVAIRRDAFRRVGGFNESLRLLEDYELSLRLSTLGDWGVIRDPLVVKFNDTNGIGVECMTDPVRHLAAKRRVIEDMLKAGHGLDDRATANLRRELAELDLLVKAADLRAAGPVPQLAGRAIGFYARGRKALRRRSPSWPRFAGHAV